MRRIITFAVVLLTMATAFGQTLSERQKGLAAHRMGSAAGSWKQHLATHKILSQDNSNEWLEPVTDEQYSNL